MSHCFVLICRQGNCGQNKCSSYKCGVVAEPVQHATFERDGTPEKGCRYDEGFPSSAGGTSHPSREEFRGKFCIFGLGVFF